MNMSDQLYKVELPVIKAKVWCLAVDTSLPSPLDFVVPEQQKPFIKRQYDVSPQSVVVLENIDC
jgi:isoamylase